MSADVVLIDLCAKIFWKETIKNTFMINIFTGEIKTGLKG